ncbi:hypothetical protein H5410_047600 [Solanum commersonii]|uniref:Uncharacterized protein n=1 Tax=Solanum commersonii TaxID=4109 RepID=A0A9J5XJ51_SOLCO|nr:hypothetical protein H5410_047600 [Solanum commersonii]
MKVDKNQLANCFLNKKWNSDEDAVKIVVLNRSQKSSKCGSDLIDKAEEQKKIIQRRKEDIIQECKLVKDDGEDIILRNRIEKIII